MADRVKVGDKIVCQRIEIPEWMKVTKGRSYEIRGINYEGDFTDAFGAPVSEYWIDDDQGLRVAVLAREWTVLKPGHETNDPPKDTITMVGEKETRHLSSNAAEITAKEFDWEPTYNSYIAELKSIYAQLGNVGVAYSLNVSDAYSIAANLMIARRLDAIAAQIQFK